MLWNPNLGKIQTKIHQPQNKPWWQIWGEQAVANEENLVFEGLIVDPSCLFWILNNTVNYCQNINDEAKKLGIKLLPDPSDIPLEQSGITHDKFCYNKILKLSDAKRVLGCQTVCAHLIRQFTGAYFNNMLILNFYSYLTTYKN